MHEPEDKSTCLPSAQLLWDLKYRSQEKTPSVFHDSMWKSYSFSPEAYLGHMPNFLVKESGTYKNTGKILNFFVGNYFLFHIYGKIQILHWQKKYLKYFGSFIHM